MVTGAEGLVGAGELGAAGVEPAGDDTGGLDVGVELGVGTDVVPGGAEDRRGGALLEGGGGGADVVGAGAGATGRLGRETP